MENRKTKLSLIVSSILILLSILLHFGCDKVPTKENAKKKTSSRGSECDCTPPTVGQCPSKRNCAKKLLGGSFSQTGVTVTWDCCPGFTSQMDICYNSNCRFKLKFYNLPPCIGSDCLINEECIELKNFNCSSGIANAYDYWVNPVTGDSTYIQITGDPHITITCPNGSQCVGVF